MRQTILHSITDIVALAAVDVMDMEKDKDRAEDSINRILTVRRRRCRCRASSALLRKKQFKNSKVRFGGTPKPARETRALPEQKMAA
jgi:hypothetical protein